MKIRIRIYRCCCNNAFAVRIGEGMDYSSFYWRKLYDVNYRVEEKDHIFIYPEIETEIKVALNEPLIKNKKNKK